MQIREKILAAALLTVLVFWLGAPWFDKNFVQPLREAQNLVDDARIRVQGLEDQEVGIIQAEGRLKRWQGLSLPQNPLASQRVYQEWLTDLTEASGWPAVKVTSTRGQTRGDTFVTVPVTLEATITWEQLGRFLTMFQEAHFLQRIVRVELTNKGTGEKRPLDVKLTAEGVAMTNGPTVNQLAAETTLAVPLALEATQLTVASSAGFPEQVPFVVRLGAEMVEVTAVSGSDWTISRGLWGTSPRSHEAAHEVQLFRTPPERQDIPAALAKFVATEYFAKPQPVKTYAAKLIAGTPSQAYFNQEWTHPIKVEGWDPEWDEQIFVLEGTIPEGLNIDPSQGTLYWTPVATEQPQEHVIEIAVFSIWEEQTPKATQKLTIKAMRANLPPLVNVPDTLPAYFGRPLEFTFLAENPAGESDRLSYTLDGQLPEGAVFDSRSAKLTWTPPVDGAPGEVPLKFTVTDSGEPPQTVTRDVRLVMSDDNARYTRLEGIWSLNNQPEAWFRDLTVNKQQKAQVGAQIKAAEIQVTLAEIAKDHVILAQGDQRWRLKPGQNLRQLELLPPAPAPTPAPAPETAATTPPAPPEPEVVSE